MAFQLLQHDRSGGMRLAQALTRAMSEIGHCGTAGPLPSRNSAPSAPTRAVSRPVLSVVKLADIHAIEQTGQFSGRYFVLMGHLSPLDGIGPMDIGLDKLEERRNVSGNHH